MTRRSVWSDPEVQARLRSFVPAADEVGFLQRSGGPEGKLFREIAEQGHYKGRVKPTTTRQGIYAIAPDGTFLDSINTRHADDVIAMLDRALARFDEWRAGGDGPRPDRAVEESPRFRRLYPQDGLVLRVHSRDLPRDDAPDDWRRHAHNRDYAWFRKDEAARMVPKDDTPGATVEWPAEISARLARLHLVDNVRGQTPPYAPEHVEKAEVSSSIVAIDPDGPIRLRLQGSFRLEARGRWPIDGFRDRDDPEEQSRGFEGSLLGRAVFDPAAGRFTAFECVVAGVRHGATQYNGRRDDLGPAPIGYVLSLAEPYEKTEPAAYWEYRWR